MLQGSVMELGTSIGEWAIPGSVTITNLAVKLLDALAKFAAIGTGW